MIVKYNSELNIVGKPLNQALLLRVNFLTRTGLGKSLKHSGQSKPKIGELKSHKDITSTHESCFLLQFLILVCEFHKTQLRQCNQYTNRTRREYCPIYLVSYLWLLYNFLRRTYNLDKMFCDNSSWPYEYSMKVLLLRNQQRRYF